MITNFKNITNNPTNSNRLKKLGILYRFHNAMQIPENNKNKCVQL